MFETLNKAEPWVLKAFLRAFKPRSEGDRDYSALVKWFLRSLTDKNQIIDTRQLQDFRVRYPMEDNAFDILVSSTQEVQGRVISDFKLPSEGESDYSGLVLTFVRGVTQRLFVKSQNMRLHPVKPGEEDSMPKQGSFKFYMPDEKGSLVMVGPILVDSDDTIRSIQKKILKWIGHNERGLMKFFPWGVAATFRWEDGELIPVDSTTMIFEQMTSQVSVWPKIVFHPRCGCATACTCVLCANCKCLIGHVRCTITKQREICRLCASVRSCEEFIAMGEGDCSRSEFAHEENANVRTRGSGPPRSIRQINKEVKQKRKSMRDASRPLPKARKRTRSDATRSDATVSSEGAAAEYVTEKKNMKEKARVTPCLAQLHEFFARGGPDP